MHTVGFGNRFETCDLFEPTDFSFTAHAGMGGTRKVILNETVVARFVTIYLNGTGALQLSDVQVCAESPIPGTWYNNHIMINFITGLFFELVFS